MSALLFGEAGDDSLFGEAGGADFHDGGPAFDRGADPSGPNTYANCSIQF